MKKSLTLAMMAIFGVTVLATSCNKADRTEAEANNPEVTLSQDLQDGTPVMVDVENDTIIKNANGQEQIVTEVTATPETTTQQ